MMKAGKILLGKENPDQGWQKIPKKSRKCPECFWKFPEIPGYGTTRICPVRHNFVNIEKSPEIPGHSQECRSVSGNGRRGGEKRW